MSNGARNNKVWESSRAWVVVALVLVLAFPPNIFAVDITWTSGGDHNTYGDSANWGGTVPSGSVNAVIDLTGANVSLDISPTVSSMVLGATNSSTLNTGSSQLTLGTPTINTGDVLTIGNGGTLNIQSGGSVNLNLYQSLSASASIAGTIAVTAGGTLALANSGDFSVIDHSGSITVTGAGSSITASNNEFDVTGAGTVKLVSGGALIVNDFASLNLASLDNLQGSSLVGGTYQVGESGSLRLESLGFDNSIQALTSNAAVSLTGLGILTGDGETNGLSGLTKIEDSSLTLTNVGNDQPFAITPGTGTLTLSATSSEIPATLTLDHSNVAVASVGEEETLNLAFTNSASTVGAPVDGYNKSTLTLDTNSVLTTGAFTNVSVLGGGTLGADALVNINNGSILNVDSLTTSTNDGGSLSRINVDGYYDVLNDLGEVISHTPSQINVAGSVLQTGDGSGGQGGNEINLTNGAYMSVDGSFANNSDLNGSTVSLSNSTLDVAGQFTQSQWQNGGFSFLNLDDNSTATVGGLLNNSYRLTDDGRVSSNVSITNGSRLIINGDASSPAEGTGFGNVSSGVLSGGVYLVGTNSTLEYSDSSTPGIHTIDVNTALVLQNESGNGGETGTTGAVLNGGLDAISDYLHTVKGELTLQNGGNLTLTQHDINIEKTLVDGATETHPVIYDGHINVTGGSSLTLRNTDPGGVTTVTNNGTILVAGDGGAATLLLDGFGGGNKFKFEGSGTLTLYGEGQIIGNNGTETLYNKSGHAIEGSGLISGVNLKNSGTINAYGDGLIIDTAAAGELTNHSPGSINIGSGSSLDIRNIASDTTIHNYGNINIDGTQLVDEGFIQASLVLDDDGVCCGNYNLFGTGTVFMNGPGSVIKGQDGTETLVNGYNHTISGIGTITNLDLENHGTINATGGGTLTLDMSDGHSLTNSDTEDSWGNHHYGAIDVSDGSTLVIRDSGVSLPSPTIQPEGPTFSIQNDGDINLNVTLSQANPIVAFGNDVISPTRLYLDGGGREEEFTLTGYGYVTLGGPDSGIRGSSGLESLVNDYDHTIQGNGTIDNLLGFTNLGTLNAYGGTLEVVSNLTNWNAASRTLTEGLYIAQDSALRLDSISGHINVLSGAEVDLYGTGHLTGIDGETNALDGLYKIYSGHFGDAGLLLTDVPTPDTPVSLGTDAAGRFTVIANDRNDSPLGGNAFLELHNTSAVVNIAPSQLLPDGAIGDLANRAITHHEGGQAYAAVSLFDGSGLTVNNLENTATMNLDAGFASARIEVDQSTLTVQGSVTNTVIDNSPGGAIGFAAIHVDNKGIMDVAGSFTNSGVELPFPFPSTSLNLTNGSTVTVGGLFTNDAHSLVDLDSSECSCQENLGFSTLNANGGFSNSGQVYLNNHSTLNNTGEFSNTGSAAHLELDNLSVLNTFAPGLLIAASDVPNNGANFTNTGGAQVVLNGQSSMNVAGQFTNGVGSSVTLDAGFPGSDLVPSGSTIAPGSNLVTHGFENSGTVSLFQSSGLENTGVFTNTGAVEIVADSAVVNHGDFKNSGTVKILDKLPPPSDPITTDLFETSPGVTNVSEDPFVSLLVDGAFLNHDGGAVTIGDGKHVVVTGNYTQTGAESITTLDEGGSLTALKVNIQAGSLLGGGYKDGTATIDGNLEMGATATFRPGDPQNFDILGDYEANGSLLLDFFLDESDNLTFSHIHVGDELTLGGQLGLVPDNLDWDWNDFDTLLPYFNIISYTTLTGGTLSFADQYFDHNNKFLRLDNSRAGEIDLRVYSVDSVAAPEPSSLSMILFATLIGAGITWRTRRRRANTVS